MGMTNHTDALLIALDDAQTSLLNFEYDVQMARERRNAAVRDLIIDGMGLTTPGARNAAIATRLHVSRAAVAKISRDLADRR